MAKVCARHPDRPASKMCHQCQKPVCKSCLLVTPHGQFCSSECSLVLREFRDQKKASGGKQPVAMGKKLTGFVMALIAVFLMALMIAAMTSDRFKNYLLRLSGSSREMRP